MTVIIVVPSEELKVHGKKFYTMQFGGVGGGDDS